ncbi:hypothetical protein GJT89_01770 [Enterobacteriaceae endosymbiont of Donacia versicolorea]|uniref:SufD family Fe-S cluster assembly protein n=1 Tax=Enterobacteriaceae endosymbiont of Donacia versicolorea TaxID=2675788 RepID=UPI001448C082|nr:SufD family Fe-S cluster assembly protein [Enterobacteriaceae endosymbiont of Donacia versicolorea]QJC32201.1 hypothetical protein GJT89_01770 [Enterobacteriaceae endosymbiont of Donacia versicolorea]
MGTMDGLMENNIYNQLKNIYKNHTKHHFSNVSEKNWLKLKFLLKQKKYDDFQKKFFKNINNKFIKNSQKFFLNKNILKNFMFKVDAILLCFINGRLDKNISDIKNPYYKITIDKYNNIFYINNFVKNNIYTYLSESLTKEIIHININNNIKNIKPLYIIYFNCGNKNNNQIFMSNYRNYIYINSNIHNIIILEHHINNDILCFNNIYNTILLNNNSTLEYYQFITNENNNKNYNFINNEYYLYNNVFFKKYDLFMSNKFMNQNNNFQCIGNKSKFIYESILFAKNNNLMNINNYLEHKGHNCYSNQIHKAITLNKAIINLIGLIKINKSAIKTDGQVNYSSLLLSDLSKINIQPGLDILNNNVKCKHGVFTGKIDSKQIFFLRTRGINFKKSYNILVTAFILDSLKNICNIDLIRNKIFNYISCYFSIENFFNEF